MAFRVILVENEVAISIKLNNLVVRKDGEDTRIPLDDISMIVIDNLSSTLTVRTLTQLADSGIGLIICDQTHLPIGYFGAYDNHSRASKILGYQISFDKASYDLLWMNIVKAKIHNQAKCLSIITSDEKKSDELLELSNIVEAGDATNREAVAAKQYFTTLMGSSYSRGNEDILLNSALNYGYAIIRGYIARLCVGYGLNTQIGIHHKNEYNRFNLVDDLMEPIRPFVDILSYRLLDNEDYFKPEHRHKLINLINHFVKYHGKKMYICNMLDEYVEQYASMLMGRNDCIDFPNIEYYLGEKE